MIYRYKNFKIICVLLILISAIFAIINYVLLLEHKHIINLILMIIFAIAPFFISCFHHHYEKLKYQIIMSIIYHKYIEEHDGYLHAILHYDFDDAIKTRKIYDELFEKITEQEWQDAIKKFHKLKKDFEEANLKKAETEENNKRIKFREVIQNQKWLFRDNLKDKK